MVLLKVSPWKGVIHSRKRGNLDPTYIRPFRIIARVGKVAYRIDLLEELRQIHNTFHVSQLRKCLVDHSKVIPLKGLEWTWEPEDEMMEHYLELFTPTLADFEDEI